MQTIGRMVKFDIPRLNRGPQSFYQIMAEYYGKEFESLKGTVAFVHTRKDESADGKTVKFMMGGFIEFPEVNYPHPEMFVMAKEHFPNAIQVGFLSERPHDAEPDKIMRSSDFEQFKKTWKEFRTGREAQKYGIAGSDYGPSTPLFDYIVANTPFSAKTTTGKPPGMFSFGQEIFFSFGELSGDVPVKCDCPKCEPEGRKAKMLKLLEMLHGMSGEGDKDLMPNGEMVSEFIRKVRSGDSPEACIVAAKKVKDEDKDEIDKELDSIKGKGGTVIPFIPPRDKRYDS